MEGESIMRHLLSLVQSKAPWPRPMVERFLQVNYTLLVVLFNGELLAAHYPPLNGVPSSLMPDGCALWCR